VATPELQRVRKLIPGLLAAAVLFLGRVRDIFLAMPP
jgi:hypothetical protein